MVLNIITFGQTLVRLWCEADHSCNLELLHMQCVCAVDEVAQEDLICDLARVPSPGFELVLLGAGVTHTQEWILRLELIKTLCCVYHFVKR